MKKISTPLDEKQIRSLRAGEEVLLSGEIYTARDQAHLSLINLLTQFSTPRWVSRTEIQHTYNKVPMRCLWRFITESIDRVIWTFRGKSYWYFHNLLILYALRDYITYQARITGFIASWHWHISTNWSRQYFSLGIRKGVNINRKAFADLTTIG